MQWEVWESYTCILRRDSYGFFDLLTLMLWPGVAVSRPAGTHLFRAELTESAQRLAVGPAWWANQNRTQWHDTVNVRAIAALYPGNRKPRHKAKAARSLGTHTCWRLDLVLIW